MVAGAVIGLINSGMGFDCQTKNDYSTKNTASYQGGLVMISLQVVFVIFAIYFLYQSIVAPA